MRSRAGATLTRPASLTASELGGGPDTPRDIFFGPVRPDGARPDTGTAVAIPSLRAQLAHCAARPKVRAAWTEEAAGAMTDINDLLRRYTNGERDFPRADLAGANLQGRDLSQVNFSGANLSRAELAGATLAGATLTGAYLSDADLRRADLTDADLSRADLRNADLSEARLTHATLDGVRWEGADLRGVDLTGARGYREPEQVALTGARLPDGTVHS